MTDTPKPPAREALALTIETPDGPLRAMLAVPPRPMRLAELALGFVDISGKLTDLAVKREAAAGRAVSCTKGCAACCSQVVPLSPPEAWLIADLVNGLPPPRRAALTAAFAAAGDALTRSGVRDLFAARIETDEQMTTAALAYFRQGIACPFLRDGSCSIYPYRPSICREYLVTSPAPHCSELGQKPIARIEVKVRLSSALSDLAAKLLGREPEIVPMTLALEWAEKNRADGQRAWPARELIEGLVAELSR